MDELIKMVVDKTGISQDQAKMATQTVLDYLKGRLPAPVAGQIDNIMKGGDGVPHLPMGEGGVAELPKALGGLFGKQ